MLFTSPGERVNLPDFGSGLLQLPFAPNSMEMAAATQFAVQAALQKWLSSYIKVIRSRPRRRKRCSPSPSPTRRSTTDVTQVQTYVYGGGS